MLDNDIFRWPVTDAMIALIMSYKISGERKFLNNFSRVFDYAMVHVSRNHVITYRIITSFTAYKPLI